jgi:hypothetical protein
MSRDKYPEFIDCRGVPIEIGHIIVYPVRRKSSMVMKEATVCEVPGKGCTIKKGIVALSPQGKKVILQVTSRCAVVSDFTKRNECRGNLQL